MGAKSRRKGKSGELECFGLLNEKLDRPGLFRRNLKQTADGGADNDDNGGVFAVEVKRVEGLNLRSAIAQAIGQTKPGQFPVLAHRRNGEPWQFLLILDVDQFTTVYELMEGT